MKLIIAKIDGKVNASRELHSLAEILPHKFFDHVVAMFFVRRLGRPMQIRSFRYNFFPQ
jgi:hypothetical protein